MEFLYVVLILSGLAMFMGAFWWGWEPWVGVNWRRHTFSTVVVLQSAKVVTATIVALAVALTIPGALFSMLAVFTILTLVMRIASILKNPIYIGSWTFAILPSASNLGCMDEVSSLLTGLGDAGFHLRFVSYCWFRRHMICVFKRTPYVYEYVYYYNSSKLSKRAIIEKHEKNNWQVIRLLPDAFFRNEYLNLLRVKQHNR